jgi:hypothetical protein
MNREDTRKLLGGYATGTLTPEERGALLTAALDDQELFNALADEEVLREYLAEPAFRRELLAATETRKPSLWDWLLRPGPVAITAALATAAAFVLSIAPEAPVMQMAANRPVAEEAMDRLEPVPMPANAPVAESQPPVAPSTSTGRAAYRERKAIAAPPATVAGEGTLTANSQPVQAAAAVREADEAKANQVTESEKKTRTEESIAAATLPKAETPVPVQAAAAPPPSRPSPPQSQNGPQTAQNSPPGDIGVVGGVPGASLRTEFRDTQELQAGKRQEVAGMSKSSPPLAGAMTALQMRAVVRPVKGKIVSIDGATVSVELIGKPEVKAGDRLQVLRRNSPVGELVLEKVEDGKATGRYTGSTPARVGDMIR